MINNNNDDDDALALLLEKELDDLSGDECDEDDEYYNKLSSPLSASTKQVLNEEIEDNTEWNNLMATLTSNSTRQFDDIEKSVKESCEEIIKISDQRFEKIESNKQNDLNDQDIIIKARKKIITDLEDLNINNNSSDIDNNNNNNNNNDNSSNNIIKVDNFKDETQKERILDDNDISDIKLLVNNMIESVEFMASIFNSKRELYTIPIIDIIIDKSTLPKEFDADSIINKTNENDIIKLEKNTLSSWEDKQNIIDFIKKEKDLLLIQQEEIRKKEEDEINRALEDDKQKRILRKQRFELEIIRLRSLKAAIKIQSFQRGRISRKITKVIKENFYEQKRIINELKIKEEENKRIENLKIELINENNELLLMIKQDNLSCILREFWKIQNEIILFSNEENNSILLKNQRIQLEIEEILLLKEKQEKERLEIEFKEKLENERIILELKQEKERIEIELKQKQDKDKIEVEKNKNLKESNKQQKILNNDIQIKSANNSGWGGVVSTKPKVNKPLVVVVEEEDKLQLNVNDGSSDQNDYGLGIDDEDDDNNDIESIGTRVISLFSNQIDNKTIDITNNIEINQINESNKFKSKFGHSDNKQRSILRNNDISSNSDNINTSNNLSLDKYWLEIVENECERKYIFKKDDILNGTNTLAINDNGINNRKTNELYHPLLLGLKSWKICFNKLTTNNFDKDLNCNNNNNINYNNRVINNEEELELIQNLGLRSNPTGIKLIEVNVEDIKSASFLHRYVEIERIDINVNQLRNLDGIHNRMIALKQLSAKDNMISNLDALSCVKSIEELKLDSNQISNLSSLSGLSNLIHLSVNTNKLTSIQHLACPQLQRLELYHNQISIINETSLSGLSSLLHLDLGRNQIEEISGSVLSQCTLLHTLVMSQNKLKNVPCNLYLPLLKNLWLSGNKLENLNSWLPIENNENKQDWPVFLPMLEKLFLQDNVIQNISDCCLITSPLLLCIDLSFNNIVNINNLIGLNSCLKIKTIQLQDNPISTSSTLSDALLNNFTDLTILSGNEIISKKATNENLIKSKYEMFKKINKWSSGTPLKSIFKDNNTAINTTNVVLSSNEIENINPNLNILTTTSLFNRNKIKIINNISYNLENNPVICNLIHRLHCLNLDQNNLRLREKEMEHYINSSNNEEKNKENNYFKGNLINALKHQVILLYNWNIQIEEKNKLLDDSSINNEYFIRYNSIESLEALKQQLIESAEKIINSNSNNVVICDQLLESKTKSIIKIQALFRGVRLRMHMRKVLSSIKYQDDELDDMMMGFDDSEFSMDEYINAPELKSDWLTNRTNLNPIHLKPHPPLHGRNSTSIHPNNEHNKEDNLEDNLEDNNSSLAFNSSKMVYGDHKRRKNSSARSSRDFDENPIPNDYNGGVKPIHSTIVDTWLNSNVDSNGDSSNGKIGRLTEESIKAKAMNPSVPRLARPLSSMTDRSDTSSITESSTGIHTVLDGDDYYEQGYNKLSARSNHSIQSNRSIQSEKEAAVGQEWGITDPKVLAMMMKRNKRLKSFQGAKDIREKNQSSEVRYQKFVKNANGHSNSIQSGCFGGKPKNTRNVGGANAKKFSVPPAWALGEDREN